jgi:dipeptidyl aminopeptidase/acylaminoacyl peptidase
MNRPVLALAVLLAAAPAPAQAPASTSAVPVRRAATSAAFDFSIPSMMRGPEVYGREPQQVRWTPDSRWIYFQWLEPGADFRERSRPFRVRAVAGAKPERVSDAHMDSVGPQLAPGALSRDRRRRVVAFQGDVYVVDARTGATRRLTDTPAVESNPSFDRDAQRVFFVRDNNAFAVHLGTGLTRQLTDIRVGPAPETPKPAEGQRGRLAEQQRALLESVRDQLARDSIARAEREAREKQRVKPLHLNRGENVAGISVSPTGDAMLVRLTTPATAAQRTIVPNYITASGYTEDLTIRTKVGDAETAERVAFVKLPAGDVRWIRAVGDSTRPQGYVSLGDWNDAGDAALLVTVSRDFKRREIQRVDGATGALANVDVLTDSAWIGGPCESCTGWLDDGRVWFVSEADGYAHLYSAAPDGSARRQLTTGRWEVMSASLTPDRRTFMLETSEGSPFERHVYRMSAAGGARTRLTRATGGHSAVLSPDGALLADVASTANRPPELFVQRAAPGAVAAQLTTSPTAEWLAFDWAVPEIVMIPASDGVQVPARIYKPAGQGNGAGVIFVHGAGYLHNVHNYWSSYAREYMFNQYLASKGYTVLDIDYRGSAGYGRDWRTAIYRHMGGRDLQDHVDGSRYLQKEFGIEPERVGLYGGSYGGFITLMALFTEPEHFGAGAALRSVTDWAHYNHGYTGRILNLPQTDTLAYRRSSPIYFAEGLEDPLLIAHGMVDVNVHFQDVVRLNERLIELGKTGWEMALYPVEDHGFVRPASWTDEYRRIFELFERHLPARVPARVPATGTRE